MLELLSYPFMLRALAAGIAVALCAGSLGHFLVLRRFAMIGDGLAHVGLGAVALGLLLRVTPIWIAVPLTAIASLGILALSERGGLYGEVAIGLVSSVSVAAAVLLASVGRGFSVDLMSYLFGSILAVSPAEVITAWAAALVVVPLLFANLGPLFSLTYDPEFAKVIGIPVTWMGRLLVMLTGVTVAVGIRAVGSLLVSSLVIFPAVTALQLRLGFRASLLVSTAVAAGSVVLGIAVAFALDLPAGATIVMANLALFALAAGFRAVRAGR